MVAEPLERYAEPPTTPESSAELLDRRERGPYNTNELIHVLFLKYLSAEQKKRLISLATDSPERQIAITELLDLYTCLFPKPKNADSTKFTSMAAPNQSAIDASVEMLQAEKRSNQSTWDHQEKMTGADSNWLKLFVNQIIKRTVNGASVFTALKKKQTHFFSTILRRDHALAATNPEQHAKDVIAGPLGVFTGIDSPRLSPELDENNKLEQICDHNQKASFLMSLLYLQHMSQQGGYFVGAKDQPGLNPTQSQAEAQAALNTLLTPDGIRNTVKNPSLAEELIALVQSEQFTNLFPTLQGATHDLNIQLTHQPEKDANFSTFSTTPFTTQGLTNLLDSIPHRVFNGNSSRFADITEAQYLSYSPAELARIIRDSPDTLPWRDVIEIESAHASDARWPIFATSITHESERNPSPHSPYTASQGKNMLEMDYRVGENGEVFLRYNQSHTVIDGMDTKEYIHLVNTVLGRGEANSDTLALFNAPLYPVKDNPKTVAEHFTAMGFSDFILGRTYNYAEVNKLLGIIGATLDPVGKDGKSISTKIYDFVQTELTNPESIRQIISSLAYEYPMTLSLFSVPDSSITNPGFTPKVPELSNINPQDELQVLCLKLRHAYEYESARLKGKTDLPPHYQRLDTAEIAKEVRNNLCPRPSFIHILDLIIATKRGGVLNCTGMGMLSKPGRFGLAAVKPIERAILRKKQLSKEEYQAIMNTIVRNLNEQSRTRLGFGTPAFLATLTGLVKDTASELAEGFNEVLVQMTGKTIAQSSTLGKTLLLWFITANSAFNKTNGLALGDIIRADGITGALTARLNFAKENVRQAFGIDEKERDKAKIIAKADAEFQADINDTFALTTLLARAHQAQ